MSEYRDSPAMVERLAKLEVENAQLREATREVGKLRAEVARLRAQIKKPDRGFEWVAVILASVLAAGILAGFMLARR